jgi:hypothetical protein
VSCVRSCPARSSDDRQQITQHRPLVGLVLAQSVTRTCMILKKMSNKIYSLSELNKKIFQMPHPAAKSNLLPPIPSYRMAYRIDSLVNVLTDVGAIGERAERICIMLHGNAIRSRVHMIPLKNIYFELLKTLINFLHAQLHKICVFVKFCEKIIFFMIYVNKRFFCDRSYFNTDFAIFTRGARQDNFL